MAAAGRKGRIGRGAAALVALVGLGACSTEGAKELVLQELAMGTWSCAPDASTSSGVPFTVTIEDETFVMAFDFGTTPPEDDPGFNQLHGSWSLEDGDLSWSYDAMPGGQQARVEGFDELTLDSRTFTVTDPGRGSGPEDHEILTEAHGTDDVTFRISDGDPWTCKRQ